MPLLLAETAPANKPTPPSNTPPTMPRAMPDAALNNIDVGAHWSSVSIKTAVARGWLDDTTDFNVNALVTRGEMVDFINRIFELERNVEMT